MPSLILKSNSRVVRNYYQEIDNLAQLQLFHEGAVSPAFAALLRYCASQFNWTLSEQHSMRRGKLTIRPDGVLLDSFNVVRGVWEAKDSQDDLALEVKKKFAAGYPKDNIIFQSPGRMILWQDGQQVLDLLLDSPSQLVMALKRFFEYQPPALEAWLQAVEEFKLIVPDLAQKLLAKIRLERKRNITFTRCCIIPTTARSMRRTLNGNFPISPTPLIFMPLPKRVSNWQSFICIMKHKKNTNWKKSKTPTFR